ncbi:MAG: hypothetical protein AB7F96_08355 [Beijerinckiaceae bacterium]
MSVVIVVSSPPDRQAFRSMDGRSAAILAEKALWPLLKAGRKVNVIVQATEPHVEKSLNAYFRELVRSESEFFARHIAPRGASA